MTTLNKWVILKISDTLHKVFAMWSGGYLDGDSWKASSGIMKIENKDDHYLVHNASGSVYKCVKSAEGTTSYGAGVLSGIERQGASVVTIESILEEYK